MKLSKKPRYRQLLGKAGEDIAVSFLIRNGYSIIDRNFKAHYGEIDIIAVHSNTLVFVEVKTRIGDEFGKPEEAVTPQKLREVIRTATYYKTIHPGPPDLMRIDVVAIEMDDERNVIALRHLINVSQ